MNPESPKVKKSPKKLTVAKSPKRHKKILRDSILGFNNSALQRLARKAGVVRVGKDAYDAMRAQILRVAEEILRDAEVYREHARRKTLTVADIQHALKRKGITYYG